MPLRDYECVLCGNRQEELIRRSDDELELTCSACGSHSLTRLVSVPARSGSGGGFDSGGGCDTGG